MQQLTTKLTSPLQKNARQTCGCTAFAITVCGRAACFIHVRVLWSTCMLKLWIQIAHMFFITDRSQQLCLNCLAIIMGNQHSAVHCLRSLRLANIQLFNCLRSLDLAYIQLSHCFMTSFLRKLCVRLILFTAGRSIAIVLMDIDNQSCSAIKQILPL